MSKYGEGFFDDVGSWKNKYLNTLILFMLLYTPEIFAKEKATFNYFFLREADFFFFFESWNDDRL